MIFKVIQTIFLASFKYLFTLPYALLIGVEYELAVLSLLIGGIGGFLFFYYMYKPAEMAIKSLWERVVHLVPDLILNVLRRKKEKRKPGFSWRLRFLARLKNTYGMWGIILTTPAFLSVPLGAILARRYYSRKRNLIFYMILSFIGWAVLYSGVIFLFPDIFLK
jgi:hypothetical protein